MALHEPFGHLQPKLWQKKGRESIWLLTTKSLESTSSRRLMIECNMALESSRGEVQLWFRSHSNQILQSGDMSSQSPWTPTRDNFRTPPWESWEKEPFGCSLGGELHNIIYGEGGGFPRVRAVVSQVCQSARGLSQHPRVFLNVN
jgi:hypothetical protein